MKLETWPRALAVCLVGGVFLVLAALLSPRFQARSWGLDALSFLSLPFTIVGVALLVAGGAALIATHRWDWLRKHWSAPGTMLAIALLAWGASSLAVVPTILLDPTTRRITVPTFLLAGLVLYGVLIAGVYLVVVRPGNITWAAMGLTRADLRRNALASLAAMPVLFGLALASELVLRALGVQQTQLDGLRWLRDVPVWQYLLVVVMAAGIAPLAEEIFFRGYVFRAYFERRGPRAAYLFSSVLFALVHGNPQALLPILVVAVFLAYLYQRTGSIIPGIAAHAFNNAIAFAALYFLR